MTKEEQLAYNKGKQDALNELMTNTNISLRTIATKTMEHQKNYSEDIYHMCSKGVCALVIAIENELKTVIEKGD